MQADGHRVAWVDYAKGFCIIMVVMMHSTLGVEKAAGGEGWMHYLVEFARPFRMPDFFMIAGLFLARVIDRDWRTYLDKKVVHFAYFYVLWLTIQFAFKAPGIAADVKMTDVATPLTFWRSARSWRGAFEGWMPSADSFSQHVPKTLPGLDGFYMAGQWVEPGGGVPTALMSGRQLVQILCDAAGKPFVAPSLGSSAS